MYIPSLGVDLKYNHKVSSYPPDPCAIIAPMGKSCLLD